MVAAIVLAYLPADIAITDRSRNFYNGTYKWDAEGFIDEHGGVYSSHSTDMHANGAGVRRKFDCLDPLARAPTPMPPTFSDDEEDDEQANMILEVTADTLDNDSVFRPAIAAVEPSTPCSKPTEPKSTESVTSTVSPRTPGSIRRFAIDFFANSTQRKTTPPEESEKDAKIDNAMVQKDVPASELAGTEGLDESHELSENPLTAKKEKSHVKLPETPPYSPIKAMSDAQIISPAASTTSTLSSVPSILSSVPSNLDEVGNDAGDKVGIAPCSRFNTTDKSRSNESQRQLETPQACPAHQQRPQMDVRRKLRRLAAWLEKPQKTQREPLQASLVQQSERRIASKSSR